MYPRYRVWRKHSPSDFNNVKPLQATPSGLCAGRPVAFATKITTERGHHSMRFVDRRRLLRRHGRFIDKAHQSLPFILLEKHRAGQIRRFPSQLGQIKGTSPGSVAAPAGRGKAGCPARTALVIQGNLAGLGGRPCRAGKGGLPSENSPCNHTETPGPIRALFHLTMATVTLPSCKGKPGKTGKNSFALWPAAKRKLDDIGVFGAVDRKASSSGESLSLRQWKNPGLRRGFCF